MCACHGLEQGGRTERRYCKPKTVAAFNTPSRWDRFTGLERTVCDPSLDPGTGLAQRDRSQGLAACEEASATRTPPQHRVLVQALC
jgi:hypothetical protein